MHRGDNSMVLAALFCGVFFAAIQACFTPLELPVPRPGATMTILHDNIYFAGMRDPEGISESDRVDILDTKNNEWSTIRLPIPLNLIRTVMAIDPFILFIGRSADRQNQVDIFNTRTRTFRTIVLVSYTPTQFRGLVIGTNAIIYGGRQLLMLDPASGLLTLLARHSVVTATTDGTRLIFVDRAFPGNPTVNIFDLETRNITSTFLSPVPTFGFDIVGIYFLPWQSAIAFVFRRGELFLSSLTGQQLLSRQLPTSSRGHVVFEKDLFVIESGQIIVFNFEASSETRYNLPQRFFPTSTSIVAHNGIIYVTSTTAALASVLTINTAAFASQISMPTNYFVSTIERDNVYWTTSNKIVKLDLLTDTTTEMEFSHRPTFLGTSSEIFRIPSEIYHVYTVNSEALIYNVLSGTTKLVSLPRPSRLLGNSDSHVLWVTNGTVFSSYNIALETWTETTIMEVLPGRSNPLILWWNMIFIPFRDHSQVGVLGVNMDTNERIWIDTEQNSFMGFGAATDTQLFLTSFAPSTEVVIYDRVANTFSMAHLSSPRAGVRTLVTPEYVFFAEGRGGDGDMSRRIDIYVRLSATWLAIDMPQHFLDGTLSLVAVNQFVYLLRTQRIDRLDMTRLTFLQLSLPIDRVHAAVVRGSKIIITDGQTYMIYETTTGEWFSAMTPVVAHQFSASFVLYGEFNRPFYVAKQFTTILDAISNSRVFSGHSHEFSTEISGPISRIAWQHENSVIEGQNTLVLSLTNVTEGGKHSVEVFDLCNQRMRQEASLTVDGPPAFITKLVDTVILCHYSTKIEMTTVGRNVSRRWSINGVTQSQANDSSLIIAPFQLLCGSIHHICTTATNPAGSAETCADLKLVENESIFHGPYPTVMHQTWFSQMTATLQVTILQGDWCTHHVWLSDGIQIGQTFFNPNSTIEVLLSADNAGRRFTVKVQCGGATVESLPFIFESVSPLTVPSLVATIVVPILIIVAAVVTAVVVRRKLTAKQEKEIELQSLLTQAKSESMSRDTVSVIATTTWEWVPTDEFTFYPLDSLPGKINVSTPKVSKEPVKVNVWTQQELTFHAPPSSIFRKKKYSLLHDRSTNGVRVDIYSPKSPKYEIKVEPESFLLEEDKPLNVIISVQMRMTANCKICLVVVFDQQKIYTAVEFKLASTISTWIDLAEIEMTGEHLGGGGFGSVNRGIYRGQDVAVKRLLSQYLTAEMQVEFEREVLLMKDLRHPNIVQFIGASNVTENLAIVIEYAPMGSLFSVMQTNKLTNSMKITILVETAKALQFLHLNRIIHRDIKPQNILVFSLQPKTPVHIKLTDFGTSRFISEDAVTVTQNVGTIAYMAPETLGKNPRIDKSADVYSFAILMWQVIYEQQPFSGFEWQSDIEIHVKSGKRLDLDRKTGAHPDIISLIQDCWHQDPAQRPLMNAVVQRLSALQ